MKIMSPTQKKRDKKVCLNLDKLNISTHSYKDHVIFSGNEIKKSDNNPYQVFTPYKKAWNKRVRPSDLGKFQVGNNFLEKRIVNPRSKKLSLKQIGFEDVDFKLEFQKPGRKGGVRSLKSFLNQINKYNEHRDFPYIDGGTSGLSVHLRFGTLSIRECVILSLKSKSPGAKVWLSELIWREFYQMILDQYPHVAKGSFKKKYDKIKWHNNLKFFKAWCEGKTGFPIIDAGMRQLNVTGWMHNRVRMITASFLVKDLLVDWRKGEEYFAQKLLDFDLASNNGGWQWCASTGCDAQPYFRIFNPSLQSKRFDPNAEYIKKWVPELVHCKTKDIHEPENSELHKKAKYPKVIIAHSEQKLKAMQLFKKI